MGTSTPASTGKGSSSPSLDPSGTAKLALRGRVVTVDDRFSVIADGVVYVDGGTISAVQPAAKAAPKGFADVAVVNVEGTLYPGLIELHNHLSYDVLPLWNVPRRYGNRDQWSGTPEYRKLITGPMKVLGASPGLLPAVVRYVECKCLLGGVTTSQGVELFSNRGARRFYRGLVRNVESTDEADLPEASARIPDIDARDAARFRERLLRQTSFLLHLSEGTDDKARSHFLALHTPGGKWAITRSLIGIHCAGLLREDFHVMAANRGSMVWSPLSNLLLYGQTARVADARREGVRVAMGSDWSPSGSKNLLGELKAARVADDLGGGRISDRDLVAMATRDAAVILRWDKVLGTIEPDKRADLVVVSGTGGDPYAMLLAATERDLGLVVINGVARHGRAGLMRKLGVVDGEPLKVGGERFVLQLAQPTADPIVGALSLSHAVETLDDALARLPDLARELEHRGVRAAADPRALFDAREPPVWFLALDELEETGLDLRPRLELDGAMTGPTRAAVRDATPISQIVTAMKRDPLTSADDSDFVERLGAEGNLPQGYGAALARLYGG